MAPLFSRRLRCFYCSGYSNNSQSGTPRTWLCGHCEAVNHLDEHGNISEPPAHSTTTAPRLRFAAPRTASPTPMPNESPFCDNCQQNLTLIDRLMAEYIPDEEDPDYDKHVASANTYRAELETRYPYPCETCVHAVNQRLRVSDYLAKSDVLRRVLQNSKEQRLQYSAPRQLWTLRIVRTAKLAYMLSVVTGILWHVLAIFASPLESSGYTTMHWRVCLDQLWRAGEVGPACFNTTPILNVVRWALVADLATTWWNPKLEEKTLRAGGRMRGLTRLWIVRATILGARYFCFRNFKNIPQDHGELGFFRYTHTGMVAVLVGSIVLSWYLVSTEYQSTKSFMRPIGPHLPQAQSVAVDDPDRASYRPAHPQATTYDMMAQSFASSLANTDQDPPTNYPPSPTLSASSISTRPTTASTPFPRKFSTATLDDEMDWTPTRPRFGTHVEVQPAAWPKLEPLQPSTPKQSLFAQEDPNPFANKVPAFPKSALQEKVDPWKKGVWAPPLPEIKRNFLTDMMKKGASPTSQRQIMEGPKRVKDEAEMFQPPQLKYDYQGYAGYKTTGLEDKFNDLFS